MKTLRITLVGLALALLGGCYTQEYTQERAFVVFAKLKNGMTESELTKILGAPKEVTTDADFVVWTYPEGTVYLREGKVYSWHEAEKKPY